MRAQKRLKTAVSALKLRWRNKKTTTRTGRNIQLPLLVQHWLLSAFPGAAEKGVDFLGTSTFRPISKKRRWLALHNGFHWNKRHTTSSQHVQICWQLPEMNRTPLLSHESYQVGSDGPTSSPGRAFQSSIAKTAAERWRAAPSPIN